MTLVPIPELCLRKLLAACSVQELRDIYGLVQRCMPWALIELVLHAIQMRRACHAHSDLPHDLSCIEFFAGSQQSSQVAKAFQELGVKSLAFDITRDVA